MLKQRSVYWGLGGEQVSMANGGKKKPTSMLIDFVGRIRKLSHGMRLALSGAVKVPRDALGALHLKERRGLPQNTRLAFVSVLLLLGDRRGGEFRVGVLERTHRMEKLTRL